MSHDFEKRGQRSTGIDSDVSPRRESPGKSTRSQMLRPSGETSAAQKDEQSEIPFGSRIGLEKASGFDLSDVRIHTGPAASAAAEAENARAFTRGDDITFNAGEYDPTSAAGQHLLAHEVGHVVQQRGGTPSVARKCFRDLNDTTDSERQADAFADAVVSGGRAPAMAAQSVGVARKPKGRNEGEGDKAPGQGRKVQRHVGVHTLGKHGEWTMAESEIYTYELSPIGEVESEGKLTTKRTYHYIRAAGTHWETSIKVVIRGTAAFDANQVPRDLVVAAKTWPAVLAHETATVTFLKGGPQGAEVIGDSGHAPGQPLAAIVEHDSLIAHGRAPSERLKALLDHWQWVEEKGGDELRFKRLHGKARRTMRELDEFIRQVEAEQENGLLSSPVSEVAIKNAESVLEEIVSAEANMGERTVAKTGELAAKLRERIKSARMMHNPDKFFGQGVAEGFVETGKMARDVAYKAADEFGEATGLYDIEWEASSAIGKMREQGHGFWRITAAVLDGIVDQIDHAITEASQGNFRPLAELGLEVGVDVLMPAGVVGGAAKAGAKGARAVAKGGKAAGKAALRGAKLAVNSAGKRAKQVSDHLPTSAPKWVRDELLSLSDGLKAALTSAEVFALEGGGLLDSLGRGKGLIDFINSARIGRSVGDAKKSLKALGHEGVGDAAFDRLLKLSEKEGVPQQALRDAIKRFSGQEGAGNIPVLIAKLEETLAVADRLEPADFARLLRKATNASDPVAYMDGIRWLSSLEPETRAGLARVMSTRQKPDLLWLKGADIDAAELADAVRDPTINLGELQKKAELASGLPNDLRAVIGKKPDEVKQLPAGTHWFTPDGKKQKQLRWSPNKRGDRPQLTLDSRGRIQVGVGDELSRALLGRSMRKFSGPRIPGHQDHHVVPIEVARDSELFVRARKKGDPPWDPNNPRNGMQLAESDAARQSAPYAKREKRPLHSGSHPKYSAEVKRRADAELTALAAKHGGVDKIPPKSLTQLAVSLQDEMALALRRWPDEELN